MMQFMEYGSVLAQTENPFISALVSGHYYVHCSLFLVVLIMVIIAVVYLGHLKNCNIM